MVEGALFASTPVDPGQERAPEFLSFKRSGSFFEGAQGSVILVFSANWSGHQLAPDAHAYILSCSDTAGDNAVFLFANGARGGRLTASITRAGITSELESAVIPQNGTPHAIALRWAGGIADFLIDGWTVGSTSGMTFPDAESLGEEIFIGNWPRQLTADSSLAS
jgi:hypothetical protein